MSALNSVDKVYVEQILLTLKDADKGLNSLENNSLLKLQAIGSLREAIRQLEELNNE